MRCNAVPMSFASSSLSPLEEYLVVDGPARRDAMGGEEGGGGVSESEVEGDACVPDRGDVQVFDAPTELAPRLRRGEGVGCATSSGAWSSSSPSPRFRFAVTLRLGGGLGRLSTLSGSRSMISIVLRRSLSRLSRWLKSRPMLPSSSSRLGTLTSSCTGDGWRAGSLARDFVAALAFVGARLGFTGLSGRLGGDDGAEDNGDEAGGAAAFLPRVGAIAVARS